MYVLVRQDLSAGQQVVQACHAVAGATSAFPHPDSEQPHLVLLGVPDEPTLQRALELTQQHGIRCRAFREADLDNQLTAFATEPIRGPLRRRFRRYRLLDPSEGPAACPIPCRNSL
jgi:hypothetical protein